MGSCGQQDERAPSHLFDGAPPRRLSIPLTGLDGPAILTRVRTASIQSIDPRSAAGRCLAYDWGTSPAGVVVERTSASGASVTFQNVSRRQLLGCDDGGGPHEAGHRWCGVAAGQLHGGRLRDPRLDIECTSDRGDPLGFLWVQPAAGARYVAVQERGYAEVYEVAGGLPIRVATTSGVDVDALRASLTISEYTAHGKLLRQYGVTATPAG